MRRIALDGPAIPFHEMTSTWFLHAGKAYNAVDAPDSVFRAAVVACMDTRRLTHAGIPPGEIKVIHESPDLYSRWWLLCYVATKNTKKPMIIYSSQQEAARSAPLRRAASHGLHP